MNKILILSVLLISGCTTIHFDNGEDKGVKATEQWHHNFAMGLYEGSGPVDLGQECGEREWSSVKTEYSFLNGLTDGVVGGLRNGLGPIWAPKTVEVSCK